MHRRLLVTLVLAALLLAAPASATKPTTSWALPQIKVVIAQGVMPASDPVSFRPDDPLTRGALSYLVSSLTHTPATASSRPASLVTISQLDSRLVGALRLGDVAAAFLRAARAAGVATPSRFGTEAVARLLGLRTNHPAAQDDLELLPAETATRAEAAFSAAQILKFDGSEAGNVRSLAATFSLPILNAWQKRILSTAFSFVGYPYVWGGESEKPDSPFGHQAQGGFDCSGFIWRVYKLQAYPNEAGLADVLRGRTTYQMSGEIPPRLRVPLAKLQPGDVIFFGGHGTRSKPTEVDHAGIYVGGNWFIHSSEDGVTVASLSGWYRDRYAWARRPLAEASLVPAP